MHDSTMISAAPNPLPRPASARRSPTRSLLLTIAVCALLGGGFFFYQLRSHAAQAPARPDRAQPVSVGEVSRHDLPLWVEAIGSATPPSLVTLQTRVDGQLMRLHFKEGETVKAGQLLAEIDPRPYEAALAQVQGQLARDTALLDNARRDLARYQALWQQDSIARQEVDTQEALVRQYQGTVEYDRALVANARLELSYTRITAPAGGRIGLRNVDPGNMVRASDTGGLASIAQLEPMNVVFTLPESRLTEVVRASAQSTLSVEAWDREHRNRLAEGQLLTLDNQIDASTGTIRLKAAFPNQGHALFPNQFVNIRLLLGQRVAATVIPATALQRGANGSYVYTVAADNTVKAVAVQTGASNQGLVEITAGTLDVGSRVVTDGADRLRDGASVEVINAAARQKAGSGNALGKPGPRAAAH